jgi:glycosyltransferase involved in cell wall biosynthesis
MQNKDKTDTMRVLILADVCNPEWPSLPVVGYKFARAIGNYVNATVVTQIRNKPNIDKVGMGNAKVVYIDTENIAAPIQNLTDLLIGRSEKSWTIRVALGYFSYLAFEWEVWQRYKQELHSGHFDVVHRITPMSPTQPSPMAAWSPIPFLLGPLNGGLPWPKAFTTELKREREWLSYVRNAYRLMPFYRSTYERSAGILAAFDHTILDLPASAQSKIINYPEVGIDPELFKLPERSTSEQVTVLFAGRLVPYKLPEVVIRAFANSSILQQHKLAIVGDGPERPRLEQLIAEQNLGNCVKLLGKKTQPEVGELMRQAEIFAFPSIRELGAGVVVEAMACGMACVVVDYGGPGALVGPDRGIKVPISNFDTLVKNFTAELEQLVADRDRVARLGIAAHNYAMNHYSWDVKAQQMLQVYQWLASHGSVKPDFELESNTL